MNHLHVISWIQGTLPQLILPSSSSHTLFLRPTDVHNQRLATAVLILPALTAIRGRSVKFVVMATINSFKRAKSVQRRNG